MQKKEKLLAISVSLVLVLVIACLSYYSYYKNQIRSSSLKNMFISEEGAVDEYRMPSKETGAVLNYGVSTKLLYKKESDLFIYDIVKKSSTKVLSDPRLIDFDLSQDEKIIVYSLKEDGFDDNSDIYVKDIASGKVTRLTEKNNIASVNPKITPDGKKVVYVRRAKNKEYPQYLDDAIWAINIDGNQDSSYEIKKISSNYKDLIESKDTYYCYEEKDLKNPKASIKKISADSSRVVYGTLEIGNCMGYREIKSFISLKDGSDVLAAKFREQNRSTWDFDGKTTIEWGVSGISLFDNGDFVTYGFGGDPIGGVAYYYFDKDQNKKWEIYDSNKDASKLDEADVQFFINDITRLSNGDIMAFVNFYERIGGRFKFTVLNLKLGDKIDTQSIYEKGDFLLSFPEDVYDAKVLDESHIFYKKFKSYDGPTYDYFVYDLKNKKEELVAENITE